jgi:branched-chain amino acid transport system substrate-binding protein
MQMFMKLNPQAFGPYKIEIVKRDSKTPSGAEAKVAVQELVAQEKVDLLTGFIYSPDAIASAALFTEAKRPAVIMNAGTAWITNLSPMISRVSFSCGAAMGVAKNLRAKTAVVGYTDFPPGKDSLTRSRGLPNGGNRRIPMVPGPGAGLHAVLPASQGQAGRVLRLHAGQRPRGRRANGALGMRAAGIS